MKSACFAGGVLLWSISLLPAQNLPPRVDLRQWQTPVRNQGSQGSCFIHANVAAMEAAYKRQGYGDLNLAEEFSYYMGPLLWLKTKAYNETGHRTAQLRVPPLPERECGLPFFDFAPESGHLDSNKGSFPVLNLPIPTEQDFPQDASRYEVPFRKEDPQWNRQRVVNNHLLESRRLPRSGLTAPLYYQIEKITFLPREDAVNPAAIEAVLARGMEVAWDFKMQGDISGPVWHFSEPKNDQGSAHRMLIVGYDRTDPSNPHFLVKNSWGIEDTRIGYDYLVYGEWASYIESVRPPRPMPELRWIGRWEVEFGQMPGQLDLTHVPSLFQQFFDTDGEKSDRGEPLFDRRLGTLFVRGEEDGPAFRVNGTMKPDGLELYLNLSKPDLAFDERSGERIELRETGTGLLEGVIHYADGSTSPARARLVEVGSVAPAAPAPTTTTSGKMDAPPSTMTADASLVSRFDLARARVTKETDIGNALSAPQACADGKGWFQPHENGDLFHWPGGEPVAIYGDIRALWRDEGAERGRLGYPVTDELDGGLGRRLSKFEHGVIWWHPERGPWIEMAAP
jgi:hypothetical protein